MAKKGCLSQEQIDAIVFGVREGMSYKAAGKQFGVSHSIAKWYCDKAGVKSSFKSYVQKQKLSEKDIDIICDMAVSGTPISQIAEKFNVKPRAIQVQILRSPIGIDIYPLSPREKSIYKYLGRLNVSEISDKLNIPEDEIKKFAYERGLSVATRNSKWSELELEELRRFVNKEPTKAELIELSNLFDRTQTAVHTQLLKMRRSEGLRKINYKKWTEEELAVLQCVIDIDRPLRKAEKEGLERLMECNYSVIANKIKELSGGWWDNFVSWEECAVNELIPFLEEEPTKMQKQEIAKIYNKTVPAVSTKLYKMRVEKFENEWTELDKVHLKYYTEIGTSLSVITQKLNKSEISVRYMCNKLNLKPLSETDSVNVSESKQKSSAWTQKEINELKPFLGRRVHMYEKEELSKKLNRTTNAISAMLNKLNNNIF